MELTAAELSAYIAGLPRLLTENLTINVSGTTTNYLYIDGFYGPGSLVINGENWAITNATVIIIRCALNIAISGLSVSRSGVRHDEEIIMAYSSPHVYLSNCVVTGNSDNMGFRASSSSMMQLSNCGAKNCRIAVLASGSSVATVDNTAAGTFFNNNIGAMVYYGGVILLADNAPNLLGGTTNNHNGGIIAKNDGTLL